MEDPLRDLRNQLLIAKNRVREARAAAAEAEKRATRAEEQVSSLLSENERLAEALHGAITDVERLSRDVDARGQQLIETREELETVRAHQARLEVDLDRVEGDAARLRDRAVLADALREQGKLSDLLPVSAVTKMVGDLVADLRRQIPGMDLKDGQVRLKVAFAGAGGTAAVVVPGPEMAAEFRDSLSELVFGFERGTAESLSAVEAGAGPANVIRPPDAGSPSAVTQTR
ncbi:MAG: hypothetical protein M3323_06640 [Actinomycetota bacterium]|nr:hypothetical protein [Actinomycetota bacterium]